MRPSPSKFGQKFDLDRKSAMKLEKNDIIYNVN